MSVLAVNGGKATEVKRRSNGMGLYRPSASVSLPLASHNATARYGKPRSPWMNAPPWRVMRLIRGWQTWIRRHDNRSPVSRGCGFSAVQSQNPRLTTGLTAESGKNLDNGYM